VKGIVVPSTFPKERRGENAYSTRRGFRGVVWYILPENGIDVIIASLTTYPPTKQKESPRIRSQELALKNTIRLVHFLHISQSRHSQIQTTPLNKKMARTRHNPIRTPCDSGAYRRNTDMPKPSPQRVDTKQFKLTSNPHAHHQQTTHKRQHPTLENAAHHPTPQTTSLKAHPTHASTTSSPTKT